MLYRSGGGPILTGRFVYNVNCIKRQNNLTEIVYIDKIEKTVSNILLFYSGGMREQFAGWCGNQFL